MKTLMTKIDRAYFRLKEAWLVLIGKESLNATFEQGFEDGIEIANSRIITTLRTYDPANFSNNHFKLGFYYAAEQVKKVM